MGVYAALLGLTFSTIGVYQLNLKRQVGNIIARLGLLCKIIRVILIFITNWFYILNMLLRNYGRLNINILVSKVQVFGLLEPLLFGLLLGLWFGLQLTLNRFIFASIINNVAGKAVSHVKIRRDRICFTFAVFRINISLGWKSWAMILIMDGIEFDFDHIFYVAFDHTLCFLHSAFLIIFICFHHLRVLILKTSLSLELLNRSSLNGFINKKLLILLSMIWMSFSNILMG